MPTNTKALVMMEQRLFSRQLGMDTVKLSDYLWSRVPTKTKSKQTMEQHLLSWQLRKGTLPLSNCWWGPVPTWTQAHLRMDKCLSLEFVICPISRRDPMTTLEYLAFLEAPACHVSNMCHCFASKSKTHQLCMFFFFVPRECYVIV